jgi:zinc protease
MLARVLALLVLVASVLVAARARAGEILAYERHTLDNGLDVVLHVDRRLPLVAVDLSYHVGWMHDGEHHGLAHLVEHVMFRGTRDLPDGGPLSLLQDADAVGTNASTTTDRTSYHTVVPADQLPVALWLESHRMAHLVPALSDRNVRQEQQTTIDEWERSASDPEGELGLVLRDVLFPAGHPLHEVRPAYIRRLRLEDVQRFVERHHGPANATLVLAGDLPDDVYEQVERYFGHRRGGERPPAVDVTMAPRAEELRVVRTATLSNAATVIMAWPTPGLYEAGDAEADVLATVLAAGRLQEQLEARAPGVFLDTYVRQVSRVGQSMFMLAARGTSTGLPLQMQAALDEVLAELRETPLSPADVRRARRRLVTSHLRGIQRLEQRAARMQMYVAAGKPPGWVEEDIARFDAIDEIKVASFVRTHLAPEHRVLMLSYPAEASP